MWTSCITHTVSERCLIKLKLEERFRRNNEINGKLVGKKTILRKLQQYHGGTEKCVH